MAMARRVRGEGEARRGEGEARRRRGECECEGEGDGEARARARAIRGEGKSRARARARRGECEGEARAGEYRCSWREHLPSCPRPEHYPATLWDQTVPPPETTDGVSGTRADSRTETQIITPEVSNLVRPSQGSLDDVPTVK